jgi:hypothetical protein
MPTNASEKVTLDLARQVMPKVDEATKEALASMGLEAFRFDAAVCAEEGWFKVTMKIRPVGRDGASKSK